MADGPHLRFVNQEGGLCGTPLRFRLEAWKVTNSVISTRRLGRSHPETSGALYINLKIIMYRRAARMKNTSPATTTHKEGECAVDMQTHLRKRYPEAHGACEPLATSYIPAHSARGYPPRSYLVRNNMLATRKGRTTTGMYASALAGSVKAQRSRSDFRTSPSCSAGAKICKRSRTWTVHVLVTRHRLTLAGGEYADTASDNLVDGVSEREYTASLNLSRPRQGDTPVALRKPPTLTIEAPAEDTAAAHARPFLTPPEAPAILVLGGERAPLSGTMHVAWERDRQRAQGARPSLDERHTPNLEGPWRTALGMQPFAVTTRSPHPKKER
ncbi:hypothetical protein DFH09DRAFT_1360140 [Mycena vulgaris]|nr:hypothetical protein DFH09DRAFT_1360140 [Mycena vulgaris]